MPVGDVTPHGLRMAVALGATRALDVRETPIDERLAPDVLLECSGYPPAIADAIRTVARAGRVVLIGMGGDEIPLPLSRAQNRELRITGTFRYANTWPTAIAL